LEAIIVIVGFLGAGKTTLLKKIVHEYLEQNWNPYIILNDYENANLDAQDFLKYLKPNQIKALSGSCICCSGVNELRLKVNDIPKRENGITLIEANGTTDAASLMGFLGVGMKEHFLPPIQIAVVDVRSWQKRGYHNELEASQVQVSSLIVLNYHDEVSIERVIMVEEELRGINSNAKIIFWNKLDVTKIPKLHPNDNEIKKMDHQKSHWASCSVDLPDPLRSHRLKDIMKQIPDYLLRVKGCTKLDDEDTYTYFERTPSGETFLRPYTGNLVTGAKLLTIGPGSDPRKLKEIIDKTE